MVVEDVIRAKGFGVVLEESIRGDESVKFIPNPDDSMTYEGLKARYYRSRYESCRDGMWFSIALNAILVVWSVWLMWR